MKPLELVLGAVLLFGATYGYFHSPGLVMKVQNFTSTSMPQMLPNVGGANSGTHLFDLNQPEIEKMILVTQYGFIVLVISGLGCMVYGIVAKKRRSSPTKEEFRN